MLDMYTFDEQIFVTKSLLVLNSILQEQESDNVDNDVVLPGFPLIQIAVVRDISLQPSSSTIFKSQSESNAVIYRYFAVRILPLVVAIDSSTLQLLYTDLVKDLKFVSGDEALASNKPGKWIDAYNEKLRTTLHRNVAVHVSRDFASGSATKLLFEKVIIHPMKVTLTYDQTPFPRKLYRQGGIGRTLRSTAFNFFTGKILLTSVICTGV